MANIASRQSVLAIVPETTEGTPVAPSSASQYTAMKPGFTLVPSFDNNENEELRSSLGKAKPIRGAENPTCDFTHYLRHSGVEGTAPDYNDLLKAFFGTEVVNGTQRTTDAGSSTTVVNVAAGTGSDFPRGAGMLVKDGTNGYSIRAAYSRSTDAITLGFALANAPASGVSLGKCVYYTPADTGHQTLSIWNYVGNGGARRMMAGGRVTEFGFEAQAGALIDASFKMEGIGFYYNPIEITSSTKYIDFEDDGGNKSVALTVGWYKDPRELAAAAQALMDAASSNTITCTYDDTDGKFDWTSNGTTFNLEWNTGANTANSAAAKFGESTAADRTGATSYSSTSAYDPSSPYTPSLDSADPLAAKHHEILFGTQSDYVALRPSKISFSGSLGRRVIEDISAQSGRSGSVISSREGSLEITALLSKYDVDAFTRYRQNTTSRFQYNFGNKDGGNWVAGQCGYLFLPDVTVSEWDAPDDDGLVTVEFTLAPFVDSSGNGEMYLGFL